MKTIKVKNKLIHRISEDVQAAQSGINFLSNGLRMAKKEILKEIRREYPMYNRKTLSYDHGKKELTVNI